MLGKVLPRFEKLTGINLFWETATTMMKMKKRIKSTVGKRPFLFTFSDNVKFQRISLMAFEEELLNLERLVGK